MNLLERCQTANATDLSDASESLVDYSGRATVLLDANILKATELVDDSKLSHQLSEMRQKISEDPSAITSGRNFTNLKKTIDKFGDQTKEVVNDQWKQHVSEIAPKIDNKLLAHHRNTSFAAVVSKPMQKRQRSLLEPPQLMLTSLHN